MCNQKSSPTNKNLLVASVTGRGSITIMYCIWLNLNTKQIPDVCTYHLDGLQTALEESAAVKAGQLALKIVFQKRNSWFWTVRDIAKHFTLHDIKAMLLFKSPCYRTQKRRLEDNFTFAILNVIIFTVDLTWYNIYPHFQTHCLWNLIQSFNGKHWKHPWVETWSSRDFKTPTNTNPSWNRSLTSFMLTWFWPNIIYIIFHQPRFPWNKGNPFLNHHLGAKIPGRNKKVTPSNGTPHILPVRISGGGYDIRRGVLDV